MKNNQAILNLTNKTINFKFNNEDFVMDLTEGDLHDNWNSFTTKDNITYDLNFTWDGYSRDNDKPNLTIYELRDNGDGTFSTDMFSGSDVSVKFIQIIGTEGEYFNIPFNGAKTSHFELFDRDGVFQLKTKSLNKACDLKMILPSELEDWVEKNL